MDSTVNVTLLPGKDSKAIPLALNGKQIRLEVGKATDIPIEFLGVLKDAGCAYTHNPSIQAADSAPVDVPGIPDVAQVPDPDAPNPDEETMLIGSSVQPSMFTDADGKDVTLGDVVAFAQEESGLSIADWNDLESEVMEAAIAAAVIDMGLEPVNVPPAATDELLSILDQPIPGVIDAIAGLDEDSLKALLDAEHGGNTRIGVVEAINRALNA